MEGVENIWHAATKQGSLLQLCDADPNFQAAFTGLDRSRIPATADSLVSEGQGLSTFMYSGRALPERRMPMQTVGETAGPAYMSHGRALHMFGELTDPGNNKTAAATASSSPLVGEPSDGQQSATNLVEPLLTELQKVSVVPAPRTEAEFREQNPKVYERTKSIVPEGKEAWTFVLGFEKFARWIPMLSSQYAELVRARDDKTKLYGMHKDWPLAESLTFEGFTNWILRCKKADLDFARTTIKKWESDLAKRKADIQARLEANKVHDTYSDARLRLPRATTYYNGPALMPKDMKKIGLTFTKDKTKK